MTKQIRRQIFRNIASLLKELKISRLLQLDSTDMYNIIVHFDGICKQNNIVIFLQSIEWVGLHYGVFLILIEDIDLSEIRISFVDIVNTDQLSLIADRKLLWGRLPSQQFCLSAVIHRAWANRRGAYKVLFAGIWGKQGIIVWKMQ